MAQKSVKKSLKAEHCVLKAPSNGLLGHPFSERVASETICRGWLRAHPSLFLSVPVSLSSSFTPALRLYCLMLTPLHGHPLYNGDGAMFNVNPLLRLGLFLSCSAGGHRQLFFGATGHRRTKPGWFTSTNATQKTKTVLKSSSE